MSHLPWSSLSKARESPTTARDRRGRAALQTSHNTNSSHVHVPWLALFSVALSAGAAAGAVVAVLFRRSGRQPSNGKQQWNKTKGATGAPGEVGCSNAQSSGAPFSEPLPADADASATIHLVAQSEVNLNAKAGRCMSVEASASPVPARPGAAPAPSLAPLQSPLNVVAGRRDPTDPAARSGSLSWDDYFMALAFLSAQRSKDPNKQVGAVIVNGSNVILGIGYNGFPRGCCDSDLPWAKVCRRPDGTPDPLGTKYPYVVHAEANALLNKNAASVDGARVYVTMFPCNECAKLLIQAGIREVVYHEAKVQGHDAPLPTATRARQQQQQQRAPGKEQGHEQTKLGSGVAVAAQAVGSGAAADPLPAHLRSSQRLQARQRWLQQQEQQQQAEEAGGEEEEEASLQQQRHKRQREEAEGSGNGSGSHSANPLTPKSTAAAAASEAAATAPPTGASSVASLTSVAAVAGSPGNPASPSPSGLSPAAAAGGVTAPSPAAAADEEGKEPWSGFWGGSAVSPAAGGGGGGRGSSSGQILSSWAKAAEPEERDALEAAGGAAEAAEPPPSATRLRVPLSAAPSDADVCYLASLRMLQLAGVSLRQHRLTRGITIPGPADLQA